jgi:hypothetical protein
MHDIERIEQPDAHLSVWRDGPSFEGRRTAALGAFACTDVETGARLLHSAADRLAREGFAAVIGPMDGDTWSAHRFVTESDGSAPFLMEPQNPPHYAQAFEAAGFAVAARYASAERAADAPIAPSTPMAGVRLRPFDRARATEDLVRIHALSLTAFAANPFYKPISTDRFLAMYLPIAAMFDPELTILAEDANGELTGFLFGIANYAETAPTSVILKTYVSCKKGLGGLLAREFHGRARARGYRRVIHALMHESNLSARHSENLGARVFRRYALWSRRL